MADLREDHFASGGIRLAAAWWTPTDLTDGHRRPAIVVSTPGSSVKEQIGANYGRRLADEGFVVLTFDPSHQGQSGGDLRDLEDPSLRIADLGYAVDHLVAQGFVDADRIGALGICAGGGYAVSATVRDHRIKALGTVVGVDIGRAYRQADTTTPDAVHEKLVAVAEQRTREARGEELKRVPWIPDSPDAAGDLGITDPDVLQAIDFYRTPRGYDEHSTNRLLFRSSAALLGYDAFSLVEELLTQPVQVIVGSRRASTGSYEDGVTLCEKSRGAEELFIVDGPAHYEFYDDPRYVDAAVERLSSFFNACFR